MINNCNIFSGIGYYSTLFLNRLFESCERIGFPAYTAVSAGRAELLLRNFTLEKEFVNSVPRSLLRG